MTNNVFFGSHELGKILEQLELTCLDIGARGGFTKDLLPLAQQFRKKERQRLWQDKKQLLRFLFSKA